MTLQQYWHLFRVSPEGQNAFYLGLWQFSELQQVRVFDKIVEFVVWLTTKLSDEISSAIIDYKRKTRPLMKLFVKISFKEFFIRIGRFHAVSAM